MYGSSCHIYRCQWVYRVTKTGLAANFDKCSIPDIFMSVFKLLLRKNSGVRRALSLVTK